VSAGVRHLHRALHPELPIALGCFVQVLEPVLWIPAGVGVGVNSACYSAVRGAVRGYR